MSEITVQLPDGVTVISDTGWYNSVAHALVHLVMTDEEQLFEVKFFRGQTYLYETVVNSRWT